MNEHSSFFLTLLILPGALLMCSSLMQVQIVRALGRRGVYFRDQPSLAAFHRAYDWQSHEDEASAYPPLRFSDLNPIIDPFWRQVLFEQIPLGEDDVRAALERAWAPALHPGSSRSKLKQHLSVVISESSTAKFLELFDGQNSLLEIKFEKRITPALIRDLAQLQGQRPPRPQGTTPPTKAPLQTSNADFVDCRFSANGAKKRHLVSIAIHQYKDGSLQMAHRASQGLSEIFKLAVRFAGSWTLLLVTIWQSVQIPWVDLTSVSFGAALGASLYLLIRAARLIRTPGL